VIPQQGGGSIYHRQHEEIVDYRNKTIPVTGLVKQVDKISLVHGSLPPGASPDVDPPATPQGEVREAEISAFGTGGKSVFPKNPKTVPLVVPMKEVPVGKQTPGSP
jgi:hypothetical protein